MSTVTLSKPHCAITSAENPDGMASQAFTTALPEAQTFLTLFVVIDRVSFCDRYNGFHLLAFTCVLVHRPLNTCFADTNLARGIDDRGPGIVGQRHTVPGAVGTHLLLGIAGDQHGVDACDRLGRPDEVDIARDFAVEEIAGVDHAGIDIDRE